MQRSAAQITIQKNEAQHLIVSVSHPSLREQRRIRGNRKLRPLNHITKGSKIAFEWLHLAALQHRRLEAQELRSYVAFKRPPHLMVSVTFVTLERDMSVLMHTHDSFVYIQDCYGVKSITTTSECETLTKSPHQRDHPRKGQHTVNARMHSMRTLSRFLSLQQIRMWNRHQCKVTQCFNEVSTKTGLTKEVTGKQTKCST